MQEPPSSSSEGSDNNSSAKPKVIELANIKIQHQRQPHVEVVENSPLKTPTVKYNVDDEDSDDEEVVQSRGRVAEHQSLLNGETEREHLGVTNLDAFFQQVYVYFYEKGFWCMLVDRCLRLWFVSNIITLFIYNIITVLYFS